MSESRSANPDLYQLLKITIDEEHRYIDIFNKTRVFYAGLIVAILAFGAKALTDASRWEEYLPLLFVPVFCFVLASVAPMSCARYYSRFLEAIATRAKIEARLGVMPVPTEFGDRGWCDEEPLVPDRHVTDRLKLRPLDRRNAGLDHAGLLSSLKRPSRRPKEPKSEDARSLTPPSTAKLFDPEQHRVMSSTEFWRDRMPLGDNQISADLFWMFRILCLGYFALTVALTISAAVSDAPS